MGSAQFFYGCHWLGKELQCDFDILRKHTIKYTLQWLYKHGAMSSLCSILQHRRNLTFMNYSFSIGMYKKVTFGSFDEKGCLPLVPLECLLCSSPFATLFDIP
ncbi:hypothetical protein CsSME_00022194 [Camellia sinensis var. sinensis]